MKKFNLIIIAVLFLLLISCAGSAKKKGEAVKKTDEPAKQTTEVAKKTEEPSADKKSAAENSAVDGKKETPNTETAQVVTDKEKLTDEKPSLETEPAAKEVAAVTPPEQTQPQTPPVQTQPQKPPAQTPPQQPPRQTQPQTPPVQAQPQTPTQTPSAKPPAEEKKSAASDSSSSDSDSQKKEPLPPPTGGPSAPAPRVESIAQMGTMPNDKEIAFSRIVYATVGQIVEIPFRGNGWIYMGEIKSQRGIVYNPPTRNDYEGQTFIFTTEEPGTYVLKFYRQDFIRDYILNDYVQIIADESPVAGSGKFNFPADRGRVVAQPRWPSPIEETQIRSGTKSASEPVVTTGTTESAKAATSAPSTTTPANAAPQQRPTAETNTPPKTTPAQSTNTQDKTPTPSTNIVSPVPPSSAVPIAQIPPVKAIEPSESENTSAGKKEILSPEAVAQKAKENFDGGKIPEAIALLDQFMLDYPGGSDEVYWLLGQYYEANSPSRNILLSLDYYRRLVNEYPQSKRFDDARRRIAYLERYYINIQ